MQIELDRFQAQVEAQLRSDLPPCRERYQALQTIDPFPEIPCALLHSGYLASYAIATGMIDPFEPPRLTKPATYAVPLMGACRYLDDEGRTHAFYLSKDPTARDEHLDVRDRFELRRNSICYITLKPHFRMPAYVAERFNLLIRDVYRGLLVGTGPLIDPGFDGYLSIPIHNLTNNVYIFSAGENFVYFEFTKLSWSNPPDVPSRPSWCPDIIHDQPPFPARKQRRRTIDDYLAEAIPGGLPAQGAIGAEMRRITETSKETRLRLQFFSVATIAGVGALILTALALAYATYDMFSSARRFVDDVELRWDDANTELQERVDEAETLTGKLDQSDTDLRRQIDEVRSEMRRRLMPDEIRTNQISELKSELADLKEKLEKVMSSSANGGVRKQPGTE